MLVLLNPHARGGRGRGLEAALRARLSRLAPAATLVMPESIEQGRALLLAEAPRSRVVLAGGDGTLHQLLPALLARELELGLVPAGSGDDSARAFGLRGWPLDQALAHALQAPARAVDVGEVRSEHEQRPFLSSVCAGFDAAVAQRALEGPGWLRGLPRYLLATFQEVMQLRRWRLRLTVDGQVQHEGESLFASTLNTPSYGGGMPAVPTARIDDGRLDLLLAGNFGRAGTLAMLPRLLVGRHLGHAEVKTWRFESMRIEAETPLPLAADGEAMRASRSIEVRIRAAALRVVTAW